MAIQYREDICICHGEKRLIVKRIGTDKYCQEGNKVRLEARRGKKVIKPLKRSNYQYKKKPTGERPLFETIWNTRKRVSFLNGKPLGDDAYSWYFSHLLRKAKGHYPKFKLYDKNIILLTRSQHDLFDNNVRNPEFLIAKDPRWQKVFDLRDVLLKEYGELT